MRKYGSAALVGLVLGGLIALDASWSSASANVTTFCNNWAGVCRRTCPPGAPDCNGTCTARRNACYSSKVFEFVRGGSRYYSNPAHRSAVNVK